MFFVWYDDTPSKPLRQKLDEARARYLQKYGYTPTHCLLSEKSGSGLNEMPETEGLTFETAKTVPQNYLWLQVLEEAGKQGA